MKIALPDSVIRTVSRQALVVSKHSPTILFAAGIVGVVGTAVLTAKATLKLSDELDDIQKEVAQVKALAHVTDKERRHDLTHIYTKHTLYITKLYAPAITCGVISVACLTQSHRILTKRNVALTAAYKVVDKAFDDYRGRVREELGEQKDKEFLFGVEEREVEVTGKDGKVKKKKIKTAAGESLYARFFNEDNPNWKTTPEYNVMFLRQAQNWANDRLKSRGYLFLNEMYHELGFEDTSEGTSVGWVWQNPEGDGEIDFGIFEPHNADMFYEFAVGNNGSILLDFNVDGDVRDWISKVNKSGWK